MPQTTVVNLYHIPKGWEADSNFVYIGRSGRGYDGRFGNPHPVGRTCSRCGVVHAQGEAVQAFAKDFERKILEDRTFREAVLQLKGKRLICFCMPKPCHGQVIADWLNKQ